MILRDTPDLESQAAIWIEKMSRPVLDSEVAAEFDRWVGQDPRHLESYARLAAVWQSDGLAGALEAGVPHNDNDEGQHDLPEANEQTAPRAIASLKRGSQLAAIALMVIPPVVLFAQGTLAPVTEYAAPRGEDRIVDLADGSRLHLSGGTKLSVRITPWARTVTIARGETYFDVAHETLRSFTVDTGGASVSVLGTAFDINLRDDGEREVRVYRGLVNVEAGNGEWRVPAGVGVAIMGSHMRSLDDVEGDGPGWREGWFDAHDTPLDDLIEQLNRKSDRPILLADPDIGALRISGRFQLGSPREVLDTLAAIHGLRWQDDGKQLVVSRS
ncbi:FecR family protein [Aurantiacibacter flavus]|uniref:FecR domain-containing protein n=1 Tax=Aurantiacibacter flavus TaxID=3145232 RepID=A0ABV0CY27_9SPHN